MGEPLADFSAEGVSSTSCLCRNTCEKPGCEHSYACWKDSELVISPASPSGDASESSISKSVDGKSSINSMQGTPRLVSAMKGTRAKQGIMTKLSVSWAPDVYDPPVTSDSHTVRGHQRSSRKGHYKYKPSKSSSRSTSGSKKDKKHSRHSSNSSSSSSSSKKDRKYSHRSTSSGGSSRTDTGSSHYRNAYSGGGISSSRTLTCVPESAKASPLVLAESATLPEIVPVLKTMEPIKYATSCGKEKPFAMLSRQFSPARYKGMFSFWSQNQLAS
ncbi:hypothetical protein BAE44_0000335 [Dichanthelium oligosanthes]|uniref:Uncharacterized protein n=1 Tax=Dichanthelium oligosanthes TaxID=888268 RepID=A0A1E5WMN4_9POAL|nr:hypothetical protein BAE44_0000335 [Dichanthelium oligosanthes]